MEPDNSHTIEFVSIYILCRSAKVSFVLMCILHQNYIEIAVILAILLTAHSEFYDFDNFQCFGDLEFLLFEIELPLPSVST